MPPESVWTSSIIVFEIRFGLGIINDGSKKYRLQDAFEAVLREEFSGCILDVDKPAAEAAALLFADKRKQGQTIEVRDAIIYGIARARHASIATRNVQHFETTDIIIINPWNKQMGFGEQTIGDRALPAEVGCLKTAPSATALS